MDEHPVVAYARRHGVEIAVASYPEGTRTAEDAARAVGVAVGAIVKSLVFLADESPVLALVSGAHRLDEAKLKAVTGARAIRRATAEEARRHSGFVIGGTPPFGHPRPLPTVVDESLLAYDVVYAAAGTPTTVFAIRPDDLVRLSRGTVADLALEA
jgi:Cys-tRNA(Pro) deacylase